MSFILTSWTCFLNFARGFKENFTTGQAANYLHVISPSSKLPQLLSKVRL